MMLLQDMPALGGTVRPTELVVVALHSDLAQKYHIEPRQVVVALQVAIGEYERRLRVGLLNLFNPLWWLRQCIVFVVRVPFYVLGIAGFDQDAAEASRPGRYYKLVASGIATVALALGILANLKQLGWLDCLRQGLAVFGISLP